MRIRIILGAVVLLGIAVFVYQQVSTEQRLAQAYADGTASADRLEWQPAVTSFEAVTKERPDYRDTARRLETARTELHLVQLYDAAMARYRAAAWPDAVDQLQALSTEAPNYKDVDARLADARRQLGLQRQYEDATARLARGDYAAAIQGFQAVSVSDSSAAAQARTDLARAHREYADAIVRQANDAEEAKNWSALEQLARQALQQNPDVAAGNRLLGRGLSKLGQYPEARQVLALATARDANDAQAFNLLGWAHLNGSGGDLALADRAYRQAIVLDPTLANAFAGLGGLQRERGQLDEAAATFRQALALDASESAAHQGLGLLALDAEDFATAEVQFRAAIQGEPDEVVFHLDLARALLGQDDNDAARAELERSKVLHPDDADVDAAFGYYFRATKQYDEAVTAYESAIERRDSQADYHLGRGFSLYDLKRYPEALDEGARAIELGEAGTGHVLRAYAFANLKQLDDARAEARQALDADPTNADAKDLLQALAR